MELSQLTGREIAGLLRSREGLSIETGPFTFNVRSKLSSVAENIHLLYRDHQLVKGPEFVDYYVDADKPGTLRNWIRPQVQFYFDGKLPFKPLPLGQAFAMLEWGMNFCISSTANQYLIIHAAVIEKNGSAVILPAPPGSGKSTLCAALANSGWRLLSDELTLVSRATGQIIPLARPISLKNQSIDVITQKFSVDIGEVAYDTAKGTVAHVRPPQDSVRQVAKPARARFIIFPKYRAGAELSFAERSQARAYMELIDNSFNYNFLGYEGFRVMAGLIEQSTCYDFEYSDLDEGIAWFDNLVRHSGAA